VSKIVHIVNVLASVRKKTRQDTDYPEIFFSFPQYLSKPGRVPQASHDCFQLYLSNSFYTTTQSLDDIPIARVSDKSLK
jgi:hypothetical protein